MQLETKETRASGEWENILQRIPGASLLDIQCRGGRQELPEVRKESRAEHREKLDARGLGLWRGVGALSTMSAPAAPTFVTSEP